MYKEDATTCDTTHSTVLVVFRRKHTKEELFVAINILIELPERTPVLLQFFMRRPGKQTSYASLFCYFANTIETGPGGHATLFIYDFFVVFTCVLQ